MFSFEKSFSLAYSLAIMDQRIKITPLGFQALSEEYRKLKHDERPKMVDTVAWAASNGDRSENADYHYGKKRLREIDRRLKFIGQRLDNLEIIDPSKISSDKVEFGATVTILTEDDEQQVLSLVGEDESDLQAGKINWLSPIGKALLGARVGDWVTFTTPKGEREVEVLHLEYKIV